MMSSGGKRAGAGRPKSDTVRIEARVKPNTARKLRRKAKGRTTGQVLDELFAC